MKTVASEVKPVLQTIALTHVYGMGTPFERRALDSVDVELYPGEFLGVIGHTGSGKSTLISHLNGLLRPASGTVRFHGRDIWENPKEIGKIRNRIGLVFQYPEYQLFEETVFKDIAFGPRNMRLSEEEVETRVREAMELVELPSELAEKSPFELSGGQKRRAAIAGVMAMQPEVLILDEPTAGLDPHGREEILAHVQAYHRQHGASVILVTHNMEEMAELSDRIYVLDHAHVVKTGTPREVFSDAPALERIGLSVPAVTSICRRLHALGLPVDPATYTLEAAKRQLLALWKEKSLC